jgi:hypothetical protein
MFAVSASHGIHEACETASESRAGLLQETRLRLSTSTLIRTIVLSMERDVKKELKHG